METLSGVIATFDRETVFHKDVTDFATIRTELIELTLEYRELNHVEMTISGYDDDPRSLYEVPEVRRWIQLAHKRWPDWLFWMTPGTLWYVILSLNPDMHARQPDGLMRIELDTEEVIDQAIESHSAALEILSKGGMADGDLDRVAERARLNVAQTFERKKLGDYEVIYPKSGAILNYRRDAPRE